MPDNPSGSMHSGKPFHENFTADYEFIISNVSKKDNDIILDIKYQPMAKIDKPINSFGNFIYNKTKKQLIQYNATLHHTLGSDQISQAVDIELRVENPVFQKQIDFSDRNGKVEFINVKFTFDLIQNGEVLPSKVFSKLIIYQTVDRPHKRLSTPTLMSEHISKFVDAKYKRKFWRDNPVITLTPEEEAIIATFEKENAFGTYFKK